MIKDHKLLSNIYISYTTSNQFRSKFTNKGNLTADIEKLWANLGLTTLTDYQYQHYFPPVNLFTYALEPLLYCKSNEFSQRQSFGDRKKTNSKKPIY